MLTFDSLLLQIMERKDYKNICELSIPLIKSTGVFIKNELNKVTQAQIETKDRNSLVTYVDKEAEKQLVEGLRVILPDSGFITEEDTIEQETKESTWIIDPLDGTSNYLHRIPHFSVSVGLMVDDQIVVGIVLNAYSGECFYAWKNGGAYLDGAPISVSDTSRVDSSVIATGFPYKIDDVAPLIRTLGHFMRYARGIRRMGSAALDLAYVACGRFDCYYETTLNAWDVAAGTLIVTEAGGVVSDFDKGQNFLFGRQVIAANKHIHQDVHQVISGNFR